LIQLKSGGRLAALFFTCSDQKENTHKGDAYDYDE